jgi:predicted dehydrogenase
LKPNTSSNRREFLSNSAAVAAGAALLGQVPAVHAAGGDMLKIGLVGCGGRGTGAARNALLADPNVKLVAMADMFRDRLENSLNQLKRDEELAKKIAVPPEQCFTGFDGYKQLIPLCDVVLLCTPPHFRPMHLEAAVKAGKHIFAEKPMAVDTPGALRVRDAVQEAKAKKIACVAGFCYRYERAKRETMKRVHDGQIGEIVALHTNYLAGPIWNVKRTPEMSDMEWQLRNWYYFTWLSGDHNVEQHCHSLDKMAWAMKDVPPARAFGLGGRQVRTDPAFGHIYDHHAVCYEWDNGVKMFSYTRQMSGTFNDVNDYVMGTEGTASIMRHTITGKKPWKVQRDRSAGADDMYQNEHNDLFASIRAGEPIVDEFMAQSTLFAIMGRMATYTGELVTWDKVLNSKEDLSPPKYEFGPLPVPPVAMPGRTKLA